MSQNDFRQTIEQELKTFKNDQVVHFAWLCAVRALPFLGVNGNFNFWGEERIKHNYSVFYALDISAISAFTATYNVKVANIYAENAKAAYLAADAVRAYAESAII